MKSKKRVLVCPLNWGLGHASRDIPIISRLLENNFEVLIAGEGESIELLKKEFPQLKFLNFSGYSVRYSRYSTQVVKMLFLLPRIIFRSINEHRVVKKLVNKHNIDIIISDNRFGVWNRQTYNIFITHQLQVKFPGFLSIFEPFYQWISGVLIKRFDACWIPDYRGKNSLSGDLSQTAAKIENIRFVGPLSRFKKDNPERGSYRRDVLFVLSGPEPQRSMLETIIYNQTRESNLRLALVRGTTKKRQHQFGFPVYDFLSSDKLETLIKESALIICRSGYSSIMDLAALRKKAVLIPTPGQTEQEYLAGYHKKKGFFYSVSQQEFDLNQAITSAFDFPSVTNDSKSMLQEEIENLKNKE